jgi:predicted transglutaminase-like cysteine proteinase
LHFKQTRPIVLTLTIVMLSAVVAGCMSVKPIEAKQNLSGRQKFSGPNYIARQQRSTEPFAHVVLCVKQPDECARSNGTAAITMTDARMQQLVATNQVVNKQILPQSDRGNDVWAIWPKSGDCEDYAVTKRHVLLQSGWPASVLLLAIGYTDKGEGHLVLVVRTTRGDLVLDNLTDEVRPWSEAGLSWKTIQSSEDPTIWYKTAAVSHSQTDFF